jgi:chloride channel protein, CIC family
LDTVNEARRAPAAKAPRVFYRSFVSFLRDLPGAAKRFWVLVGLTGVAAGLGAALLVRFLALVQDLVWPHRDSLLAGVRAASAAHRILVVAGAGALVSLVSLLLRGPLGGHGTAGIIEAIWLRAGRLPFARALLRGVVSIAAVGAGAPLGREGALLQVGAATGSWLGDKLRVQQDQRRLLVACGAAAGIAAAYNVPIGGALFGLEVLLGSFAFELFGPIVVSCVSATLISRILIADHPSYAIPHYSLAAPRELLVDLAVGALLGVASALYVRAIEVAARLADRVPRRLAKLLPTLALGAVGVLAVRFPEILGNGYEPANAALLGVLPLSQLLLLPFLKLAATAVASASGVPGGLFTPSLFFGALLGGALGHVVHGLGMVAAPPGAYALLGMGAVLAGTTHAAISAVLIIFELTGDYGLILPIMLAAVLSAGVSRRLEPQSLYTSALRRRNVVLPEPPRPGWVASMRLAALVLPGAASVPLSTPFHKVVLELLALKPGRDLYVVDEQGRYAGVIVLDHLKAAIPDEPLLSAVVAADVMDRCAPLTADQSLAEAAARFAQTDLDKLPVIHPGTGELVGAIAKGEVLRHARF